MSPIISSRRRPTSQVVGLMYANDFVDPKNHDDNRAPEILSHHAYLGMNAGAQGGAFFGAIDSFVTNVVEPMVAKRDAVAPECEMVLNEWIPFITDWCDLDTACPNFQDKKSHGLKPNRKTLGWNAGAAAFACES